MPFLTRDSKRSTSTSSAAIEDLSTRKGLVYEHGRSLSHLGIMPHPSSDNSRSDPADSEGRIVVKGVRDASCACTKCVNQGQGSRIDPEEIHGLRKHVAPSEASAKWFSWNINHPLRQVSRRTSCLRQKKTWKTDARSVAYDATCGWRMSAIQVNAVVAAKLVQTAANPSLSTINV
ncbi:hypothetical protein ARMSODRAFT_976596 [Armillaria solidipes]|uniref:Uncharacterized protein n=1 Tax=Armillaria solidipes TaxID=1076256 RepID=A0A2H3BG23_9AGAR|nr:hypothetical protein ARMSODRAFT_976596 [Armillaria solidipes]